MDDYKERIRELSTEKALAVAAYGESVAAYRYRTLCEKTSSQAHRELFAKMADEEQGHHLRIRTLLYKHFPGSDFVLTDDDKELVTVGQRMLDVTDCVSFQRALDLIIESEQRTGHFYAHLHEITPHAVLKPLLKEMAAECVEHAERLRHIPPLD